MAGAHQRKIATSSVKARSRVGKVSAKTSPEKKLRRTACQPGASGTSRTMASTTAAVLPAAIVRLRFLRRLA